MGILGGTFNPPHLGHLAIASNARAELDLERVLLMPVHTPPHKGEEHDPGPLVRLRMCALLAADDAPAVAVCPLEVERGGPSYTVDTLRSIHASHPDAELTFIVGADSAITLPTWREPQALLELATLAVASRDGADREQVLGAIAEIPGDRRQRRGVRFLHAPQIDVSASLVRERVSAGEPVDDLVGPAVAAYIAERGLYRATAGAGA